MDKSGNATDLSSKMENKNFTSKALDWIKTKPIKTTAIGVGGTAIITTAILLPILLSKSKNPKNPQEVEKDKKNNDNSEIVKYNNVKAIHSAIEKEENYKNHLKDFDCIINEVINYKNNKLLDRYVRFWSRGEAIKSKDELNLGKIIDDLSNILRGDKAINKIGFGGYSNKVFVNFVFNGNAYSLERDLDVNNKSQFAVSIEGKDFKTRIYFNFDANKQNA